MSFLGIFFALMFMVSSLYGSLETSNHVANQKKRLGQMFLAEKREKCKLKSELEQVRKDNALRVHRLLDQKMQMFQMYLAEKRKKCALAEENTALKKQLRELQQKNAE